MTEPFEELAGLDKLLHEPARLAILTSLSACERADFLFLQRLTGLTKGNLSAHLRRLEEAGLAEVEKVFADRIPVTRARITPDGQTAITRHWEELERLRDATRRWQPEHAPEVSGRTTRPEPS